MELNLSNTDTKDAIFTAVGGYLDGLNLRSTAIDTARPWGGFFVIDEAQTASFIATFFPDLSLTDIVGGGKLSPKILVVEPHKRLSWQYHNRRAELWCVLAGPVGVITSDNDQQGSVDATPVGDTRQFGVTVRHRLAGLDNWGVVAEIWQHSDPSNPSNEQDIVRVADDFGR